MTYANAFRGGKAAVLASACIWFTLLPPARGQAEVWLTHPDGSDRFTKQNAPLSFSLATNSHPTIAVDKQQVFQSMEGFGYTLTGGSALHISRMSEPARARLLHELFSHTGTNIGVSYLRVSIGASDLDERVFSYNDLPKGHTDPQMNRFDLAPDRKYLIPVLEEILAINPDIRIMGSPWSAPTWMKTNNDSRGGSLKPEFHQTYANYFVRYIQGMQAEGIRIDAVTVQNEPLHPGNNPSMFMDASQQAEFVKKHLGPGLRKAGLATKIIIYDHNCDRPDYPLSILNDPDARGFVHGSAFHLYAGRIEALAELHRAHPDKAVYFTEQWIGAPGNLKGDLKWHVKNLIVGATRNWSRTVLEWNLAADPRQDPHTDRGGCDRCLGAVTIAADSVTRNPAYYIIAHASKFVRPGSVRIFSSEVASLPNVAFKTPAGKTVLIVLNEGRSEQTFNVRSQNESAQCALPAGSVATLVW